MSFFVDANVPIYTRLPSDYQGPCMEILAAIAAGEADGHMSTAALEEVWHLELSQRAGSLAGLTADTYAVFSPVLAVTDEILGGAFALPAMSVGANDRVHVATCKANGIDTIVTADGSFDSVAGLRRVDPLDELAVAELCAAKPSEE